MHDSTTQAALMPAIPIRNPLAREGALAGGLRLTAPRRPSFLGRFFRAPIGNKSFDLDALGTEIWRACDGRTSIEQIITAFARDHKVNLRQSHISVVSFLNTLLARNLITLVCPVEAPKPSSPGQDR